MEWNNKDRANKGRTGDVGIPRTYFKAISPVGAVYYTNNQREFAREHGLDQSNITKCLKGEHKQHQNWKFNYVLEKYAD